MTENERSSRTLRAQSLVDLVEKVEGGYRVRSSRDPDVAYFISKPNGRIVCTCSDFEKHFQEDTSWRCKHIEAAILAHKQGKINGDGRTQAPEAAAIESPSPDGAEISEEEASQDLEATVPEFSEEEATSLDSCGKCGRTFAADELFPTNGPDGSSLLCWECMETVSGSGFFPVPGLKTNKPGTRNQEPVLTYPCICCGADGLAYREVVPHAMNPEGDEGTICLSCLEDIRADRVVERLSRDGVYVFVQPNGSEKRAYSTSADGADAKTIPAQAPCCHCGRFLPLAQLDGEGFCSACLAQERALEITTPTLAEAYEALTVPFPAHQVELKPGKVVDGGKRALALAFVSSRAYQDRLDRVVGPEGWEVSYQSLGERAVICRLTILGVIREDVGEAEANDPNAATSAVAQAFKRACSAFGLGRYLYSLPKLWVDYNDGAKTIVNSLEVVKRMYKASGF